MPHAPHSIVIHGHFYQPPREDPWLDEVEVEATAAPYHDWNERIERECYRTVVAAHLTRADAENRIIGIVNTLEWISFNFGPTLLQWLQDYAPRTYDAIIAADRASVARLGYGNAIAQPYHHVILPLASRRDKLTEVRWGIADFRRRFGREPLGMWLPETAVDSETLDVLAECGIKFTILAPHQVVKPPPKGVPGLYTASNGASVALCIYDGDLSHGVAFGSLLTNAGTWAARMLRTRQRLTSIATDGETYGHHHKFAEMALARVIAELRAQRGVVVENFASYLAQTPASEEVELVEPTSWSCAHGVERWRAHCGCRINGEKYPSQEWRAPLRNGLEVLAAGIHALYEKEGKEHFADPWAARDAYGDIVTAEPNEVEKVLARVATRSPNRVRAAELLEMERDALRMFTSCAWFFDDIGGLEPRQVLRYAAHACQLAGPGMGRELEEALLEHLQLAHSNDAAVGTGRDVYERTVAARRNSDYRVAAGIAAAQAYGIDATTAVPRAYRVSETGNGVVRLLASRTGRVLQLQTEVASPTPDSLHAEVRVTFAGAGEWQTVLLTDFPERARGPIRAKLRHLLLTSSLTTDELAALAQGDASLRELVARALVRAIHALPNDTTGSALRRAQSVLDLLDQLETPVPFDAQTAWWHVHPLLLRAASAIDARALGIRLGFDPSAFVTSEGASG
ncbi:MAG: DUF3536 domain-containing protein [Gemmatimonadota bacterium]